MRKAIIGGTGIYNLNGIEIDKIQEVEITTEYGAVSLEIGNYGGTEIVFLPRHGKGHGVPPHKINYRANMMALKELEVDEIFATCAVGSLNEGFPVGSIVILKDFLDFTQGRESTFHEGYDGAVAHVVMDKPYCPDLSKSLSNLAREKGVQIAGEAVYVCTQGPRFETAAEIKMFGKLGGDVVGMTNVPECVLAKELGMCYSAVGIVSNWCTGFKDEKISMHDIDAAMSKNKSVVTELFVEILIDSKRNKECKCKNSLILL